MRDAAMHPSAAGAIQKFDNKAFQLINSLRNPPTSATIYHYTDAAGLYGLLSGGKFWLSDVKYLNDPREIAHGLSIACGEMMKRCEELPPDIKDFGVRLNDNQAQVIDFLHFHACCFTSQGNDLGQWRAYGANGHGFAVGFNSQALGVRIVEHANKGISLRGFPLNYDDELLRERARSLFSFAHECLPLAAAETKGSQIDIAPTYLGNRLAGSFLNLALHHKEPFFQAEQEYRLLEIIATGDNDKRIKRRLKGMSFIPYSEIEWARTRISIPLESITIGPALAEQGARDFVNECLAVYKANFEISDQNCRVKVEHSGKPYRS